MNTTICLYKGNEQIKTFQSLAEATKWAVTCAEEKCTIKLTLGDETLISCVEGSAQKVFDKKGEGK